MSQETGPEAALNAPSPVEQCKLRDAVTREIQILLAASILQSAPSFPEKGHAPSSAMRAVATLRQRLRDQQVTRLTPTACLLFDPAALRERVKDAHPSTAVRFAFEITVRIMAVSRPKKAGGASC